jgi:hypothetical protein
MKQKLHMEMIDGGTLSKGGLMLKFFLIFSLFILPLTPIMAQDSSSVVIIEEPSINYPGKPLIMSLVLPGAGQYYNKSPMWKTASFLGVELGSIVAWDYFTKKAETLRKEYWSFADSNWDLYTWYNFAVYGPTDKIEHNGRQWTENDFSAMSDYEGTHHLLLHLSGELSAQYGEFITSDSLGIISGYLDSDLVNVVRDRHFYENIGKYDQFVGGWSDANTDWYWEEKQLEDSTEIVIKTPFKADYIDQRFNSNKMLNRAKFSITALLFNHVISGLEAVLTNQKQSREKLNPPTIETDVSLLYNPYNPGGVGGVAFTINF